MLDPVSIGLMIGVIQKRCSTNVETEACWLGATVNLPNADQARVGCAKITECLLSNVNRIGGARADFFISFGFSVDRWEEFAAELKLQGGSHEVDRMVESAHAIT